MDWLAPSHDDDAVGNAFLVTANTKFSSEGTDANFARCQRDSGRVFTPEILFTG